MDQLRELAGSAGGVALLEAPVAVAAPAQDPAEVLAPAPDLRTREEVSADMVARAAESLRIQARRNEIAAVVGSVGMTHSYAEVVSRVEATEIPIRTGLFLVTGIR